MKAIKVTVDFQEWGKVENFLSNIQDGEVFSYLLDNVSFIIVTEGECSMVYVKVQLAHTFEEEVTITNIR